MVTLATRHLGLGQTPALLVIDATRGFTDATSRLGCDADTALAQIARLLQACRAQAMPIFFTTNSYANDAEASVFREKLPVLNGLVTGGYWAEIDPRVAPLNSEPLLRKTVPSAFFDSPLRGLLAALHVDSVLVCGFSTSGCVRATAVDALQCNLRVTVVDDACGDRDAQAHDYNLRDLALKTGDVIHTADALAALATRNKSA